MRWSSGRTRERTARARCGRRQLHEVVGQRNPYDEAAVAPGLPLRAEQASQAFIALSAGHATAVLLVGESHAYRYEDCIPFSVRWRGFVSGLARRHRVAIFLGLPAFRMDAVRSIYTRTKPTSACTDPARANPRGDCQARLLCLAWVEQRERQASLPISTDNQLEGALMGGGRLFIAFPCRAPPSITPSMPATSARLDAIKG